MKKWKSRNILLFYTKLYLGITTYSWYEKINGHWNNF